MKFGLTKSIAVQIRKQPDEESLNRLVQRLNDNHSICYTYSVHDNQIQLHLAYEKMLLITDTLAGSFWPDAECEFVPLQENKNLLVTFRPTKMIRSFLSFFFGFLIFVEVCLALAVAFGGLKDFWSLLFPVPVGTVVYLISYFATFDCVKKITAAIEKCL